MGSVSFNSIGKAFGTTVSVAAIATLTLSACGSDNNTDVVVGLRSGAAARRRHCGGKKSLKASGSSAQANAMTRFVTAYEAACPGFTLNYTSSGSGAGVSEFIGGQTDFGGSDSPLNADKGEVEKAKTRCGGSDAWNLPMVFGPIAITYNVAGVDGLVLDGPTAAKIFNGAVTDLGRPGDRGAERGQDASGDDDHRDLPQRRVRHHRQLPEVPGRRLRRRVGQGRRQDLQRRCRRGREGQRGHLRGDQEHPRFDHLQRVVVREEPGPADRQHHHLRRAGPGRAERRFGR